MKLVWLLGILLMIPLASALECRYSITEDKYRINIEFVANINKSQFYQCPLVLKLYAKKIVETIEEKEEERMYGGGGGGIKYIIPDEAPEGQFVDKNSIDIKDYRIKIILGLLSALLFVLLIMGIMVLISDIKNWLKKKKGKR